MNFLVVADSVARLKPAGDTTLVIARAARRRGHTVAWCEPSGVRLSGSAVECVAREVESCAEGTLPVLGLETAVAIERYDGVWIRKDPPFDAAYMRFCWLLATAERQVWMANRPSLLVRYHEKLIPLEAVAQGFLGADDVIPTYSGDPAGAREFAGKHGRDGTVVKPFLGHGGNDIQRYPAPGLPKGVEPGPDSLVQPFLPEVLTHGDRRVFFLDGECIGHFARIPAPGGFVSNLAQGGTAHASPLTPAEQAVVKKLGAFLKSTGFVLAGADLMGARVSEVNVTSPTGLVSLANLDGGNPGERVLIFAERSVAGYRR